LVGSFAEFAFDKYNWPDDLTQKARAEIKKAYFLALNEELAKVEVNQLFDRIYKSIH